MQANRTNWIVSALVTMFLVMQTGICTAAESKAGDRIVTTAEAPIKIGTKTLTTVPKGTELVAKAVKGDWIAVTVERDGEKVSGWLRARQVTPVLASAAVRAHVHKESCEPKCKGVKVRMSRVLLGLESGAVFQIQEITKAKTSEKCLRANASGASLGDLGDYMMPDTLRGTLPEKTVLFGRGWADCAILVNVDDQEHRCPLMGQMVAYFKQGSKEFAFPVLRYSACPLYIDRDESLEPIQKIRLGQPLTISIVHVKDNVLYPSASSVVPFSLNAAKWELLGIAANAMNVKWVFEAAGLSFEAGGKKYTSEKAGATIEFTDKGLTTQHIKVEESGEPSPKAPVTWDSVDTDDLRAIAQFVKENPGKRHKEIQKAVADFFHHFAADATKSGKRVIAKAAVVPYEGAVGNLAFNLGGGVVDFGTVKFYSDPLDQLVVVGGKHGDTWGYLHREGKGLVVKDNAVYCLGF